MSTITPADPEQRQRTELAAAHRTVATIYDNPQLPMPRACFTHIDQFAQVEIFVEFQEDVDAYVKWLEQPVRNDHTTEAHDRHSVRGTREGVTIEVCYIVALTPDPVP